MKHEYQESRMRENGTLDVYTVNKEPSMTQQQYAEECDINNIMNKYQTTGEFLHVTSKQGAFSDFSNIGDYQSMLHTVQYAQDAFMALPANMRSRFRNDPGELLTFLQDPKNYDEGVKLGLLNQKSDVPIPSPKKTNDDPNDKPTLVTK